MIYHSVFSLPKLKAIPLDVPKSFCNNRYTDAYFSTKRRKILKRSLPLLSWRYLWIPVPLVLAHEVCREATIPQHKERKREEIRYTIQFIYTFTTSGGWEKYIQKNIIERTYYAIWRPTMTFWILFEIFKYFSIPFTRKCI